ncbi:MAG: hypothetical protein E6K75_09145 [Candidatus Eisenbacteria bacterium]|uniref:NAD-dependent epimerase/dehydratase family protein n=1 Tax=Eiseniibacteriota bacterium TaxID=2212470 RepID=A0A538SWI9_UNCEI|nr:MAG: hypothetical protein E6K75_09145 [Candidatus Eisenbacteria bacterium]
MKCHVRPRLPGSRRFSIVYAVDHARAVWEALTQDRAVGRIYFVGGPDLTSFEETGRMIERAMETWSLPFQIPGFLLQAAGLAGELVGAVTGRTPFLSREKIREITSGDWIVSSGRIRTELGWSPATALEDGIRETARWYREAGWV